MEIVEVYRARYGGPFVQAMEELEKAGLNPVPIDNPHPNAVLVWVSAFTVKIRIGVPAEEEEEARAALREWAEATLPAAGEHAAGFRRSLFFTILILLAGAGVLWLAYPEPGQAPWWILFVAAIPVLVVTDRLGQSGMRKRT